MQYKKKQKIYNYSDFVKKIPRQKNFKKIIRNSFMQFYSTERPL